ncbi:MAG: hypothetical protein M0T84_03530 [Betaproteobacteria bacterium]|nr:hypothetical protein [Betaproteobacteria bacterium]
MEPSIPEWVIRLCEAGGRAPSADNSQPWRFVWDGEELRLTVDEVRAQGLGQDHPALFLALGAVIENIIQAVQAAGLPLACVRMSDGSGHPREFLRVSVPPDRPLIPRVPALLERHTHRGDFSKAPLPASVRARLGAMEEPPARAMILEDRAVIRQLARLIERASEARFRNQELHRWFAQSLRYGHEADKGDGLAVDTLHLPPGGALLLRWTADWKHMAALNRFGAYKLFGGLEAAKVRRCGAIIAIIGSTRSQASMIASGRLMERMWLQLNADGVAVHPFFGLTDQVIRWRRGWLPAALREQAARIAKETAALLGLGDEEVLIVLRAGMARKSPKRSRRLPLSEVLAVVAPA